MRSLGDELVYPKEDGKKALSLPRLSFRKRIPISQTASFLDTNRGERPNLTASTSLFLLRAINHNQGYENRRNHSLLQVFDGTQPGKSMSEKKLTATNIFTNPKIAPCALAEAISKL